MVLTVSHETRDNKVSIVAESYEASGEIASKSGRRSPWKMEKN